ncbi:MAG: methylmalonyl-CoA epimerase [Candidatus Aminicenantales bacterium]|jgi:methylmalonyl-CoA/ethylmalonyl-CoA epimerase
MIRKIDHVGIAVRDLEKQTAFYRDVLGLEFEGFEDLPGRGLRIGVFNVGGVHIELLQPTVPDNTIAKFIEKSGEGIHHLAFTVDDAAQELERLGAAGVEAIDAEPRPGAGGAQVAFLHPKSTFRVLMELCEHPE